MGPIKLLTFDIYNTIIRVIGSPGLQYAKAAQSLGIGITSQEINKVYRTVWKQKKKEHPNYGQSLGMTSIEWWTDFVHRVFIAAGFQGNHQLLNDVSHKLWDSYNEGLNYEMIPHSRETLTALRARGISLGVISNFDERLEHTLSKMDLINYFDFIVTSISAQCEKPNPRIFHLALKEGGVSPSEAGHVGDDLAKDYLGAKMVGMTSFLLIPPGSNDPDIQRHLNKVDDKDILRDMKDLLKYF